MRVPTGQDHRSAFFGDPWFAALPDQMQGALLSHATWHMLRPHQALTHGGDTSGGIVGLAAGTAMLVPSIGPAEAGPIHMLTAPIWFGLMPLSKSRPRAVSAVAQTPCRIARVSQRYLHGMLSANPGWWQHMHDLALTYFLLAAQTAADLHIGDSRRRLCAVLLRLADSRHAGVAAIAIPVGQQDLATMANMSRQTVGQALKALAADGLVAWSYRSIRLLDPVRLREMTGT